MSTDVVKENIIPLIPFKNLSGYVIFCIRRRVGLRQSGPAPTRNIIKEPSLDIVYSVLGEE